jgi:hypothetical protein
LLVLGILKTEKSRVRDRFISYSKYLIFYITLERSKTRQDKFESILEIIESVVSSPFVKAEADSEKKMGSALTKTENWDLLVDYMSRWSANVRCRHFSTATHDFGYRLSTDDK